MSEDFAPYDAPAAPDGAPPPVEHLTPGLTRYRLDRGPMLRARTRRAGGLGLLAGGAYAAYTALQPRHDAPLTIGVFTGLLLVGVIAATVLRARREVAQWCDAYAVAATRRLLRRVQLHASPAEVLLPGATAATLPSGDLSIVNGDRTLIVPATLSGFAALRDHVAEATTVHVATRIVAPATTSTRVYERELDPFFDDPALVEELKLLRAATPDDAATQLEDARLAANRQRIRTTGLWLILILMFLGIWTFLTPR